MGLTDGRIPMSRQSKRITRTYTSPYSQKAQGALSPLPQNSSPKKQRVRRGKTSKVEELMARVERSASATSTISIRENKLKHAAVHPGAIKNRPLAPLGITQQQQTGYVDEDDRSEGSFGSLGSQSSHATLNSLASRTTLGGYSLGGGSIYSRTSMGTTGTHGREMSLRAMVSDIERRAKSRLEPPEYVPLLGDLPLSMLSWSAHRAAKAARKRAAALVLDENACNPKIDIIAMHQPVALILAKAHDRSTKQHTVLSSKQDHIECHRRNLIASIHHKMTRAERYAAALQVRQKQAAWLKVFALVKYTTMLHRKFVLNRAEASKRSRHMSAVLTLQQWFKSIFKTRLARKFEATFRKRAMNSIWMLRMFMNIKRKKLAMKKVINFLQSFKGNYRVKQAVHRFVGSALLIQKNCRDFIGVNRARAATLGKIWDEIEFNYVLRKLEERRRLEKSAGLTVGGAGADLKLVKIDPKLKIEMERQADTWRALDTRMEKGLKRHRQSGLLPDAESMRSLAQTKVLPPDLRLRCLQRFLSMRRKAFVLLRDEVAKQRRKKMEAYSSSDAHDLLKGRTERIDATIRAKYSTGMQEMLSKQPTFVLFKNIDRKALLTMVEKVHDAIGTFAIQVRARKPPGSSLRPPSSSEAPALHPSIVAARKAEDERARKKQRENVLIAIDKAASGSVLLVQPKLVIAQSQLKRRANVTLSAGDLIGGNNK